MDLKVTALVTGFSELLVVKNAAAAANPALAGLSFGLRTVGLAVSSDPATGALSAKNPRGVEVFSSGTLRMWDSTGVAATAGAPPSVTP